MKCSIAYKNPVMVEFLVDFFYSEKGPAKEQCHSFCSVFLMANIVLNITIVNIHQLTLFLKLTWSLMYQEKIILQAIGLTKKRIP